jgi:DNA repair protein RAD50
MPPNTRDGAFVHDPKLTAMQSVKGYVRLKFKTADGASYIASRNMQLSRPTGPKKKAEFKTLDISLTTEDLNGESKSISTRAADMDSIVPDKLGVSKAILESVIFVHQEESNWPLSEPSELKKKFDSIFDATGYRDAAERLRKLAKGKEDELKTHKLQFDHAKSNQTKASNLRTELQIIDKRVAKSDNAIAEIKVNTIDPALQHLNRLGEALKHSEQLKSAVRELKNNEIFLTDALKDLEKTMTLLPDSIQDLQHQLTQMAYMSGDDDSDRLEVQAQIQQVEQTIRHLEHQLATHTRDQGKLLGEKDTHASQMRAQTNLIHELAIRHGIHGYEGDLTHEQAKEFATRLESICTQLKNDMDAIRNRNRQQSDRLNADLGILQSEATEGDQRKKTAVSEMQTKSTKVAVLRRELLAISETEHDVRIAQSGHEESETQCRRAKETLKQMDVEIHIRAFSDKLLLRQRDLGKAKQELAQITENASTHGHLDAARNERARKEDYIKAELSKIVQHIPGATLENYDAVTAEGEDEASLAVTRLQESYIRLQSDLTTATAKSNTIQFQVSEKRTELNFARDRLSAGLQEIARLYEDGENSDESWEKKHERFDVNLQSKTENASMYDAVKTLFVRWQKDLELKNCCGLCARAYDPSDKDSVKFLADKLASRTAYNRGNDKALQQAQLAYDAVMGLESYNLSIHQLMKEIPGLETTLPSLNNTVASARTQVEQKHAELNLAKQKETNAVQLRRYAGEITRTRREIATVDVELRKLESQASSSQATRSLKEVQEEIDALEGDVTNVTRDMERLRSEERAKKDEVHRAMAATLESKKTLDEMTAAVKRRVVLESEISQLNSDVAELRQKIEKLDMDMQDWEPRRDRLNEELNELRRLESRELGDAEAKYNAARQASNRIKDADAATQAFRQRSLDHELRQLERSLAQVNQQIVGQKQRHQTLVDKLHQADNKAAEQRMVRRNLEDNVTHRQKQTNLDHIRGKIREAEQQVQENLQENLGAEHDKWTRAYQDGNQQIAQLTGQSNTHRERRSVIIEELEKDYKDVDAETQRLRIATATEALAVSDLKTYKEALESAILAYHKSKMDEINKIIQELWSRTYKWRDIDNIEILSDSTDVSKSNYRVVMVKGDERLDMRGRCSAGQKVLACIIIRLALAQAFGINCGILALDEPTTNLDVDNIENLADALVTIIEDRRRQANFQLLLISHDEAFVQRLNRAKLCEYYYITNKGPKYVYLRWELIRCSQCSEINRNLMSRMGTINN